MQSRHFDDSFSSSTISDYEQESKDSSSLSVTQPHEVSQAKSTDSEKPVSETVSLHNDYSSDFSSFGEVERDYQVEEKSSSRNESPSLFSRLVDYLKSPEEKAKQIPADYYINQSMQENMGGVPFVNEDAPTYNQDEVADATHTLSKTILSATALVSRSVASIGYTKTVLASTGLFAGFKATLYKHLESKLEAIPSPTHFEQYTEIKPTKMISTDVENISDTKQYQLGFGRKLGFNDLFSKFNIDKILEKSPLKHSAIAFLDLDEHKKGEQKKWLMLGRQSTVFEREHKHNPAHNHPHKNHKEHNASLNSDHLLHTVVANEKNYDMMHDAPFSVDLSEAVFSGAEIKRMVANTNNAICESQTCTVVGSNCYSASIFMLTEGIAAINERMDYPKEKADQEIISLFAILKSAALNNLSEGVANNKPVVQAIDRTIAIMNKRGLEKSVSHANTLD